MKALLRTILAVAALAACGDDRLTPLAEGPPLPPGTPRVAEAVDGLVVGHRLMAAGEFELALQAYLRAASERGADADVLAAIGSANLRLGRLGQAEQVLRRAIEADPDAVPAHNNLGVVLMERGRWGEASREFRIAFALDSGDSDLIRENLRLALEKLDDPGYRAPNDNNFSLVRRGNGRYLLLAAP
ncbi:MAG: tetratricopeptide repeat protein [Rhodobacteraceae bacterium]|nr:tetratricopeptide repeat protein [Paracoccaceae bacterium]